MVFVWLDFHSKLGVLPLSEILHMLRRDAGSPLWPTAVMLRRPDKSMLSAQRVNIGANDDATRINSA